MLMAKVLRGLFSIGFARLVLKYLRKKFGPTYVKWHGKMSPRLNHADVDQSVVKVEEKLCVPGKAPKPALVRNVIESLLSSEGVEAVNTWVEKLEKRGLHTPLGLYLPAFQIISKDHPVISVIYGKKALNCVRSDEKREWVITRLAAILRRIGRLQDALEVLGQSSSQRKSDLFLKLVDDVRLLREGFNMSLSVDSYVPKLEKVMYVAHYSLPYMTNGYATRTHGLLSAIVRKDVDLSCLTRLGFPMDTGIKVLGVNAQNQVDDVTYSHIPSLVGGYNTAPMHEYIESYTKAVVDKAQEQKPAIIHCASNYVNGLAGTTAAKILGIPSIYEVRGLWHYTRASRDPDWTESDHFKMMSRLEVQAAQQADVVMTLTEGLRDELISRGVEADKIKLLPNGVDVHRFNKTPKLDSLATELGLKGCTVIGYIGSVLDYEGLDDLLSALSILKEKGFANCKALIVGDGNVLSDLKEMAKRLNIEDMVRFTGRVSHDQVERFYSLVDIAVFPRKPVPVCELVSPLKPFEAMAMHKAIVVSSVKALKEIAEQSGAAYIFEKGSPQSLADTLIELLSSPEDFQVIGDRARKWVAAERSWESLAGVVTSEYTKIFSEQKIFQAD